MTTATRQLIYLANLRLPAERANALQTAHMAAAFAEVYDTVTLYYPNRRLDAPHAAADLWTFYDLPRTFTATALPCLDTFPIFQRLPFRKFGEFIAFWLVNLTFALSVFRALRRQPADAVIYARDLYTLAAARLTHRPYIFEAHQFPNSRAGQALARWILARAQGIVTLTHAAKVAWATLGFDPARILVAADGARLDRFNTETQAQARAALNIPADARIALYSGSLFAWKGIATLLAAAHTGTPAEIWILGGTPAQIAEWHSHPGADRVRWLGQVPPTAVPRYLAAADLLLLPNSAHAAISVRDTSPLKLFEYMAAHRPIIASDLPSLRDVLTDDNAVLIPPDDPAALAAAIQHLLSDPAHAQSLAHRAAADVQGYSWSARAAKIQTFITTLP